MKKTFPFLAQVWLYPGKAGWYFVTLPTDLAQEIDFYFAHKKRGWGSLPVLVTVGKTSWKTSIFPEKKSASYLLPLKAVVRKQEAIREKDTLAFSVTVLA